MKVSSHADHTQETVGIRAEDIHKWIDGFFDAESFEQFLRAGSAPDYDPYNHRKYRHCAEALEDAYAEFEGTYSREQIKAVFECHVRDDYNGYLPCREDFESGAFAEKYHEVEDADLHERILSEAELSEYFKGKAYAQAGSGKVGLSSRFYYRIVWPTVIAMILFVASAFMIVLPFFRTGMMERKKEMIRELTATAASAIEFYVHQEQSGNLSLAAAQQEAAKEIAELRYGYEGKDYFWITDMHPRMVMHPYRTELSGHDLTDYVDGEDKSGKRIFVEFAALVRDHNEGYLEYLWQWKDDASRTVPKLSYVRGIPEWGWIIGTGVYIHDVEQEMNRLSRHLMLVFGIIAAALSAILVNVVFQSRRIERDRKQAELGLREAKDRYRALVESSSEGYALVVAGETIYSNRTLQRMTGYGEEQVAAMKIGELLAPDGGSNEACRKHLEELYAGNASSAEFEAQLQPREGAVLDVRVRTARIFFSQKNGHIITFGKLARGQQDIVNQFYKTGVELPGDVDTDSLVRQIAGCESAANVIGLLEGLPAQVRRMVDRGVRPEILRETIGVAYDAAVERFIRLALDESGEPQVPFAFLSLGSNARHEMTMFSDQDNALVFADTHADSLSDIRRRFLKLADGVCARLNQAGYPYCSGGIMAANPKWCLSLSEWKKQFGKWIANATAESILEVNVFFDIRCTFGDDALARELKEYVQELTARNPEFFIHYARNCLLYKTPSAKKHGLELKECLKPIETFARIYALKHGISEPSTFQRLEKLKEAGIIQEDTAGELAYVFNYLWQMRFINQIVANAELKVDANELDLGTLTDIERGNLRNVLARIPVFQSRLSYDFLGVNLG